MSMPHNLQHKHKTHLTKLICTHFYLGIFLGYSLLNVLEYLVAMIFTICRQKKRDDFKVHEMIKVQEVQRKMRHDISIMQRNMRLMAGELFSEEKQNTNH